MTLVGTDQIVNVDVEIHADKYGRWSIREPDDGEHKGGVLASDSDLDKAKAAARIKLNKRKVKVVVKFFTMANERGVADGFHARNQTVLATVDNKREQLDYRTTVFKPEAPRESRERHVAIISEIQALNQERRKIESDHTMQLGTAVEKEIQRVLEERESKGEPEHEPAEPEPVIMKGAEPQNRIKIRTRRHG